MLWKPIPYTENTQWSNQFSMYILSLTSLTAAEKARIDQSIEAFVVLGVQVNVQTSILGDSGGAEEVRREFLVLTEDAIQQPDISKSVKRFQLAVQEAKVKLDLAISPGTWLIPSRIQNRRAIPSMKLGIKSGGVYMIPERNSFRYEFIPVLYKLPHLFT